jgi:preprotein translocase subunit YajC
MWLAIGQQGTTDAAAPPPPMASGPGQASQKVTIGADGAPVEGGAAAPSSPFGDNFFLILIFVMVAVVGFSMLSQRKEKKRRASMLSAISKNDTVQTIGGIIGRVVELKPDTAVLETHSSSNTRITVSRQALQQVLESTPSTDSTDTEQVAG